MPSDTIRFFVGCAANHEDLESQAVLEWSIRKHSSLPVEITWMRLSEDPTSPYYCDPEKGFGWRTELWATPFSGFRWVVPAVAGCEGKAIYCDSDFIFLADPAELWNQEIPENKAVLAKGGGSWRLCCSLWNCLAASFVLPEWRELATNPNSHREMTKRFGPGSPLLAPFSGDWNNLDGTDGRPLSEMKALHYTNMHTQPQLAYALPRLAEARQRHWFDGQVRPHPRKDVRELFALLLDEATKYGYGIERYKRQPRFSQDYRKRSFAGRKA